MAKLEERLRNLSIKFNHPDKAYAILSRVRESALPELEQQFAALQEKAGEKVKAYSVQLLIDYARGIQIDKRPPVSVLQSNYCNNIPGDGNRMRYPPEIGSSRLNKVHTS